MRLSVKTEKNDWLDRYSQLASLQSLLSFDQTPEWFEAYIGYVVPSYENTMIMCIVDEDDGKILLGMPLLSRVFGRLSIRCVTALSNYYTSLFQPILLGSDIAKDEMQSCLVSALSGNLLQWDEMILEPMAQRSEFFKGFCRGLDAVGYPYLLDECFVNWYLDVGGQDYEAYEKSLPSKLRNTFRRKQRKLERELGYTIHIVQGESDLDKSISDYEAVYDKSWKLEESHPQFIRAIIKSFAQKGWLRLGFIYIDEKPVAAQLWFVKDHVASIYKLSYDDEYGKYSVGSILMAAMMRQVIDVDGVKIVDFLTGDDVYKKDWMSHQQARYRIRIYNKYSWRGQVLAFWNMKVKPSMAAVKKYFKV